MELSFHNLRHLIAIAILLFGTGFFFYAIWLHQSLRTSKTKLLIGLAFCVVALAPYLLRTEIYAALAIGPGDQISRHFIETLFWVAITCLILWSLQVLLWKGVLTVNGELLIPQFIVHLTNFFVLLVIAILFLHFVAEKDVSALATGAGAFALALGYLAKTPLESVFAALSFSLSPMFRKGDMVSVEAKELGGIMGTVVDMGWLHVSLKTKEGHVVHVQNLLIEKAFVYNFTHPHAMPNYQTELSFEYEFPMTRVLKIIEDAMGDLGEQVSRYTVHPQGFGRFGITYIIRFALHRGHHYIDVVKLIHSAIYHKVQREARHDFGYDKLGSNLHGLHESSQEALTIPVSQRAELLRATKVFSSLDHDQLEKLAKTCVVRVFGPPEHVIKQGAAGDSMFVIAQGHVRVLLKAHHETVELVTLGAGKYFGEMALLTGQPRQADVVALDDVVLLEISKDGLSSLLEKEPSLAGQIALSVAQMEAQNEALQSAAYDKSKNTEAHTKTRSEAIRLSVLRFFGLSDNIENVE